MAKLNVLILGSGAGAHCYAGLASSRHDVQLRILTLTDGQAQNWSKLLATNEYRITFTDWQPGQDKIFHSKPHVISNEPSKVVPGSHIIVFMVDNIHETTLYFEAIKTFLRPGMIICSFQSGCQAGPWMMPALAAIDKKVKDYCLMTFYAAPWDSEIQRFGVSAIINNVKNCINGGDTGRTQMMTAIGKNAIDTLEYTLLNKTKLVIRGHLLGETLAYGPPYVHPPLMYGHFVNWDGESLARAPTLYSEATALGADMVAKISEEALQIRAKIEQQRPHINLSQIIHKYETYRHAPDDVIMDKSSLLSVYHTHKAVQNVSAPTIERNRKLLPEFQHPNLSHDVPCGLVAYRGIAEIVGVATPNMDILITWAQEKLGKEYLIQGELRGRDIPDTMCPQRFGITTLRELLGE